MHTTSGRQAIKTRTNGVLEVSH